MRFSYTLSFTTLAVILSACSSDNDDSSSSATPTPEPTPSPTPTTTPTASPRPSPTVTPSPTPAPDFSEIGIFNVDYNLFTGVYAFLENGDFYGIHYVN